MVNSVFRIFQQSPLAGDSAGTQNEAGTLKISENTLRSGIYFYEIKINSKIIYSDKIVIIK